MSYYFRSISRIVFGPAFAMLTVLFLPAQNGYAQNVALTRYGGSNVTLRGISMADFSHSMCVGDSATILINLDTGKPYTYWINAFNRSKYVTSIRTWKLLPSPVSKNRTFYGVSYWDTLNAIIVGDGGLILRTSDQGSTWTEISHGLTRATLRGITKNVDGVLTIAGDSGLILRSIDSGHSWTRVASGTTDTLFAVTYGSNLAGMIVGQKGIALSTTDGGQSWQPTAGLQDPTVNFYAVAMSGPDSAIVVGDSSRIRYTNDGKNWHRPQRFYGGGSEIRDSIGFPLLAVTFTGASKTDTVHPYAVAYGRNDALFGLFRNARVSHDGGIHYQLRDTVWGVYRLYYLGDADGTIDMFPDRFNCITSSRSTTGITFEMGGDNGAVSSSTDTQLIRDYPLEPLGNLNFVPLFVSFDPTGHGFVTCNGGAVYKSSDGTNWTSTFFDSTSTISSVYCFDSNTAVIAGWNGHIYRTSNGGKLWTTEPNSVVQYKLHSFAFPTHDVGICVGDQGTIIRTTDAGISWKDVGDHQIPFFLNSVAFSNASVGVLVGQDRTIRRTTDGGQTWDQTPPTPLDNLPNANLKYIDAFPNGTYYIGSDSGVIKSIDYGQNWFLVAIPPCSIGTSFYSAKIGIISERTASSVIVPDTMILKFTTDGGTSWSNSFSVPILNDNRLVVHWLDDHTFLLYGIQGWIVKVDLAGPNVVTHVISHGDPSLRLYPNPSQGPNVTIEYAVEKEGPVSIELIDDLGRQISSLYSGTETSGEHSRTLALPPDRHGSYIVSLTANGEQRTLKVVKF